MEFAHLNEIGKLASASNLAEAEEIRNDQRRQSPTADGSTKNRSKKEQVALKPLP